jgi:hypothetical protein
MSDAPAPTYRVASYSVFPTGFAEVLQPERKKWCLTVADGGDGWAIRWRSKCLNYRNQWESEPPPASRSADFLHRCRFNEFAALHRARQVVDHLRVRGLTFQEFVEGVHAEAQARARAELEAERRAAALKRLIGNVKLVD